jgi:hypothetical protein
MDFRSFPVSIGFVMPEKTPCGEVVREKELEKRNDLKEFA